MELRNNHDGKKTIKWFHKVNLVSYLKMTSYLYKHHTLYVPSQVRFLLTPNVLHMVDAVGNPAPLVSFAGRAHIVEYIARKGHVGGWLYGSNSPA